MYDDVASVVRDSGLARPAVGGGGVGYVAYDEAAGLLAVGDGGVERQAWRDDGGAVGAQGVGEQRRSLGGGVLAPLEEEGHLDGAFLAGADVVRVGVGDGKREHDVGLAAGEAQVQGLQVLHLQFAHGNEVLDDEVVERAVADVQFFAADVAEVRHQHLAAGKGPGLPEFLRISFSTLSSIPN